MREIFLATLRARLLRSSGLTITLSLFALALALLLLDRRGASLPLVGCMYALAASNGILGDDVRNGTAALLLARPLSRSAYLFGRLMAGWTLAAGFVLLLVALVAAVHRPPVEAVAALAVSGLAAALWTVTLITFFSTFIPGRADAVCALALFVSAGSLHAARHEMRREWLVPPLEWLWDNVTSTVVLSGGLGPAAVTDLLRWSSNVLIVVLAAAVIFNRREFSYAD